MSVGMEATSALDDYLADQMSAPKAMPISSLYPAILASGTAGCLHKSTHILASRPAKKRRQASAIVQSSQQRTDQHYASNALQPFKTKSSERTGSESGGKVCAPRESLKSLDKVNFGNVLKLQGRRDKSSSYQAPVKNEGTNPLAQSVLPHPKFGHITRSVQQILLVFTKLSSIQEFGPWDVLLF